MANLGKLMCFYHIFISILELETVFMWSVRLWVHHSRPESLICILIRQTPFLVPSHIYVFFLCIYLLHTKHHFWCQVIYYICNPIRQIPFLVPSHIYVFFYLFTYYTPNTIFGVKSYITYAVLYAKHFGTKSYL